MPSPGITKNSNDPLPLTQRPSNSNSSNAINRTTSPDKQPILLNKPPRHLERLIIRHLHRIIDQFPAGLEIRSQPIDPDPLDNRIDLVSPPRALPLGTGEQNPVFDLVVQPAPLRIGQHDSEVRQERFQVQRHAGDRAACACARDESVEAPGALGVDLWSCGRLVREVVRGVFELVGEETAAGFCWVRGVCACEKAGAVYELRGAHYGGGGDEVDDCAEF